MAKANMPRITMSLAESDINRLNKAVSHLDLNSSGQLMRMLLSGDAERIDWIVKVLKNLDTLF